MKYINLLLLPFMMNATLASADTPDDVTMDVLDHIDSADIFHEVSLPEKKGQRATVLHQVTLPKSASDNAKDHVNEKGSDRDDTKIKEKKEKKEKKNK